MAHFMPVSMAYLVGEGHTIRAAGTGPTAQSERGPD